MNVKSIIKNSTPVFTQGVSAAGGIMVSKGAMSYAPAVLQKPLSKLGIATACFIAAAVIPGEGTLVEIAKGVTTGIGVQQTTSAIAGFVSPSIAKLEEGKAKTFLNSAISGMAGVENVAQFNLPSRVWGNESEQVQPIIAGVTSVV
jgi:hypothetical protein